MLKKISIGAFALIGLAFAAYSAVETNSLIGIYNVDQIPPNFTINGAVNPANAASNNATTGSSINTSQTTAPALTSCGTSPSVSTICTDTDCTITTGSGSPTTCTVTFAAAHKNAAGTSAIPNCVVTSNSGSGVWYVSAASATAVTFTGSATSTGLTFLCLQ